MLEVTISTFHPERLDEARKFHAESIHENPSLKNHASFSSVDQINIQEFPGEQVEKSKNTYCLLS